jgi:hypothetical protein
MFDDDRFNLRQPIQHGLIAGVIALSVSAIGMVELFAQRQLITGALTLGQLILFLAMASLGFIVASKSPKDKAWTGLTYGLITGLVAAVPPILLVLLAQVFDIRQFLVNVSPGVIRLLTFNRDIPQGLVLLFAVSGVVGLAGAGLQLLPARFRRPILNGLAWTLAIGLLSEILSQRLRTFFGSEITRLIFQGRALGLSAALILLLLITAIAAVWQRRGDNVKSRYAQMIPGSAAGSVLAQWSWESWSW